MLLLIICTTQSSFAIPAREGKLVRVGISNGNFKEYYFNNISASATDNFTLVDKKTNTLIANFLANEDAKIVINNNFS